MSQVNINRLPIEILYNVFDLLSFEEQQTAMLTCVRWLKIITSKRYLMQRRVNINLNAIADSANTEALLRYRAFSVADDKIAVDDDLNMIRRFLEKQVAEHLEELRLILIRYTWTEFFTQDELYFPKLRKFSLKTCYYNNAACDHVHKRLVAPELREMLLENVTTSIVLLVQLYSEQLEQLHIKDIDERYFPAIFGNSTFGNLRSLTISSLFLLDEIEFNSTQKDMFARLTSLELNYLRLSSKFILQEASNLETLIINGFPLYQEEFSQIAQMMGLKELCLLIDTRNIESSEKLSLPHLEKLTILSGTLGLLGNLPRLRQLFIENDDLLAEGTELTKKKIKSLFQKFNQQVETLTFSKMFLNTGFVDQLGSMSNLRSLELHEIEMKLDVIWEVCRSLNRRGQRIHFECCVFGRTLIPLYNNFMPNGTASLEAGKIFFRELIPHFPHHRISQKLCRIVDFIEDNDHLESSDIDSDSE